MKKITIFLLLLALLSIPVQASTIDIETIRVGLYFGDSQLTSANLANENGAGFYFGYYSDKTSFVPLGSTTETAITMVIGSTVYLSGTQFSTDSTAGTAMGSYHALHSAGYPSYDAAYAVANTLSQGFVAWIDGDFQVRSGAFLTSAEATNHSNAVGGLNAITGTSTYSINIVKTGTTELLFQFDGGSGKSLGIEQDLTNHSDPQVWFKNILYRGGFQYQRVTQGNMVVSNIVPLETYVKGVVPYEMSPSWPVEALKAQAVSARTYGVLKVLEVRHSSENFDICNNAHCQVYNGIGGPNTATASDNSDLAVDSTANQFLWYGTSLAETYYSSSHGGASEAVSNVWTSSNQSKYPYLTGVIDPYEQLASNINSRSDWTVSYTTAELNSMLQNNGLGVGSSVKSLETVYSDTGNAIQIIVHWANGASNTLSASELRYSNWFALPSIHFVINETLPTISQSGNSQTSTQLSVNGTSVSSLEGLYALSSTGTTQLPSTSYLLTASGTVTTVDSTALTSSNTVSSQTVAQGSYSNQLLAGSHVVSADTYYFNGSGWGHNIGMSQFGAYAMAYHMNFTFDEILEFYFPGTEVRQA